MRYFRYFSMIILLLTVFSVCCLGTSEKITIQSFEFYEYVDEDNNKNEDLLTAKIEFSSPIDAKQFSILLMSDNLTELNSTNVGKVIYIDQFASVQNGVFEFTVEKSRIASALDTTDIDGCILYAKIGGMGIDEATLMSVVYSAPRADILYGDATGDMLVNISDAIFIAQALASDAVVLTDEQRAAADVYSDGNINISDLILLQQHLASPDITLGPAK